MDGDLERLIPIAGVVGDEASPSSISPLASSSGKEALSKVMRSWAWKKFMTGGARIHDLYQFHLPCWCVYVLMVGSFYSQLGEWLIRKMLLISYIYSASKQISAAISPDQKTKAFKEVAIIRHPRVGEYAIGFITSTLILHGSSGQDELCCVFVPTNHLYIGDIIFIGSKDILRPNLSVREGIEIVISGGMSIPRVITARETQVIHAAGLGKYAMPPV